MVWLWWVGGASAQVNTDSLAGQPTTAGPSLGVTGGFALVAGNVSSVSWSGGTTALHVTLFPDEDAPEGDGTDEERKIVPPYLRDRVLLYATANRVAYSGELVDRQALAHARYTRMWVRRFGTEAFAQLQNNPFQFLQERLLLGGGVRFDAVHEREAAVWGGIGAMFERETVAPEGEPDVVNLAARGTSYLTVRWDLVPGHLSLSNTAYFQPRLDDPADFRVLSEGRISAKVNTALSLGTDLTVRHDTRPPEDVKTTDARFGASLTVALAPKPKASPPPP